MPEPKNTHVLLMEDNPGLARLFQKRLSRQGYEVDVAQDGKEGLAMYDAGTYDILVMDHVMPVYTGLQVIRILAERGPLPPLIMVTGTGSEQIAVEAMKLGASDYLVKDVDGGYFELLPSVIEQALRQHRLLEEKRQAEEERKALLRSEREQRLLAETLAEVALALTSLQDRDEVLDEILCRVQRIVPYTAAHIALLNNGTLRIEHSQGYETSHTRERPAFQDGSHPASEIDLDVIRERRPRAFADVHQEPRWTVHEGLAWIRSSLALPICLHDQVIGLLRLDSDIPGEFSERDAKRLEPLVAAAAIALENARLFAEVQRLANTDDLTNTLNRRRFFELAELELNRTCRFEHSMAAIMLDLDNFKRVNDTFGHAIGDEVLRAVAELCAENIREIDILGRYGGEEFAIILPETDLPGAQVTAERLRYVIADTPLETGGGILNITISAGVTVNLPTDKGVSALLDRADAAMYEAKQAGRNRVFVLSATEFGAV